MIKEYKAHIFMIFAFFRRYFFVLLIPLFTMLISFILDRKIRSSLIALIALFCGLLFLSLKRFKSFKLAVSEDKFSVCKGFILKCKRESLIKDISSITIRQNIFERLFGCAAVLVSTESDGAIINLGEFYLKISDAKDFKRLIFGEIKSPAVSFGVRRLAVSAILSSSAITGLLAGIPFVNRLGKLLGSAIEQKIFDDISRVSHSFKTYFPPVFNTVAIILLLSLAFSAAVLFLRVLRFRLFASLEVMEVRSGFFTTCQTTFSRNAIKSVVIDQTLPMYLFSRYLVSVNLSAKGQRRGEMRVIMPSLNQKELERIIKTKPELFEGDATVLRPARTRRIRLSFLRAPIIALTVLTAVLFVGILLIPTAERLFLFISIPIYAVIVWMIFYFGYNYRFSEISFGNTLTLSSIRMFRIRKLNVSRQNIAYIKLSRGIRAQRIGTATAKLAVCARNSSKIRVWHLDYTAFHRNMLEFLEKKGKQ